MKKLIRFFSDARVISIIGLLAISCLVWFAGPSIRFGENNYAPLMSESARLLMIIFVILIWGLNNLRIQYVTRKKNEGFIEEIEKEQDHTPADDGQSLEELKILNERFAGALDALKKLRFRGKYNSSKAIYELPWYIIIGPPGSGKTTALVNSGLEFPLAEQLGRASLQGIGGTRNCDWWFTNEAVMIDTAGRYTTQDSHRSVDSAAWTGFLKLLQKNRPRRPINGAIIAISIQDLLLQTDEERSWHAKTIRNRIDELTEQLGIRFPVYVMLTKCDLISGFTEYFSDYSHADREDVCGVTFANNQKQPTDFDWWSSEYDKLVEKLFNRVIWRTHQERDVARRSKIQSFPQEVEALKPAIESFMRQAFSSSRYHEQPYLRGIYFSSGTQDGTPIDRLMTSIAHNFGFDREIVPQQPGQGKSYFIGRLFRDLIFSESELVGTNRRVESVFMWVRRAGYAVLALAFVGSLTAWTGSIARNKSILSDIDTYLAKYTEEKRLISPWNRDLRRILPTLNALSHAASIYDQDEHPWLNNLGLYDSSVDDSLNKLYGLNLQYLLQPRLIQYIESSLNNSMHESGALYDTLKAYLMFENRHHYDEDYVRDWYKHAWAESFQGKEILQQQFNRHLSALLRIQDQPLAINTALVESTRQNLLRIPVATRVYERIKSNPELSAPINIGNYLGDTAINIFQYDGTPLSAFTMPYLFTKNGYDDLDFSVDSPFLNYVLSDDWVLGEKHTRQYDDSQLEEIGQKVKGLYLADYAKHWQNALAALDIKSFDSLNAATSKLSELSDSVYSPFSRILDVASANTQLTPYVPVEIPGAGGQSAKDKVKAKAGRMLAGMMEGNRVDKQFRKLNHLNRESQNNPAPINATLSLVAELFSYINDILISPEPNEAAYKAARNRFSSSGADIFRKIQVHAAGLPEPMNKWLMNVSQQSWGVVLASARNYLRNQWRTQVYSVYKAGVQGKYPIDANARPELEIYDFAMFFKPDGVMDKFTKTYLAPFIKQGPRWTLKSIDGRHLGLSKKTVLQLQRADRIKKVFFSSDAELPSFEFQSRPVQMKKTVSRFILDMGGEKYLYRHGPKFWKKHSWPGGNDAQRVSIYFETIDNEILTQDFEGAWSWYRLLDISRLHPKKQSNLFEVTYSLGDSEVKYEIKASSVVNAFSEGLLSYFRCPEVL